MSDLDLRDTPALAILLQLPKVGSKIDPSDIRAAQDLLRVSKKLLGNFRNEFERRGLSPGRYAALMALYASRAPLAPSEVAKRLGVTRPTVAGLVGGLVRDGLVEYLPTDLTDRRRKEIALTAKGRSLLEIVVPDIFALMVTLLMPLSVKERATLLRLLNKVETGLRSTETPLNEQV